MDAQTRRRERRAEKQAQWKADQFWLQHFAGMQLRDITESKIYSAMQKMTNRRHEENWKLRAEACRKKGNLFQNTRQNQRPLQRRLRIFHL